MSNLVSDQYHQMAEQNAIMLGQLIRTIKRCYFFLCWCHQQVFIFISADLFTYLCTCNLLLISTSHSVMRYLIVSSSPSLTASPSGVSPPFPTAPIVVIESEIRSWGVSIVWIIELQTNSGYYKHTYRRWLLGNDIIIIHHVCIIDSECCIQ